MSRNGFPECEREYNKREEAVEMARKDQLDEQGRLNAMGQEREARLMAELAEVKRESLKLSALVVERDYQITLANKGYDYEGAVEDARHYKEVAAALREELAEAKREREEARDIHNSNMNRYSERAEKAEAELSAAKKKYLQVCAQHGRLVDQVYEEDGETLKQRELAAYKMWAEVEIADLRDDVKWMSECEERALAAEKDAGRYRWLRDKSVPPHNFYLSVPVEFDGIRYTPQEVDAAIDAAIGAKHEG